MEAGVTCQLTSFIYYVTMHSSVWILVFMSAEKSFAIFFPFRAKHVCTVKVAKFVCAVIIIVWSIFESQWFFLLRKVDDGVNIWCDYNYDFASNKYFEFYNVFDSCVYSFIPCTFILFINVSIITRLMIAKFKSGSGSGQNTLSKTAINTSILLLSVSISFFILTIPSSITFIMRNLNYSVDPKVYAMTIFLFYINHSINAALYCFCGSKFRKEALKMLYCCGQGRVGPETTNSNSASATG